MFGAIYKLCARIKKLDQEKLLKKVYKNKGLQQQIVDLNQDQMYEKGVDSEGQSLGEYSANTIEGTKSYQGKIQKGQRYDHITLKDSGKFYDSMRVKGDDSGNIVISANMQKEDTDLEKEFPKALGLTNESLSEVRPLIRDLFVEEVRKAIQA